MHYDLFVITELNNDNKSISKLRCITAFHKADKILKCPTESKEILFNGIERGAMKQKITTKHS